MHDEFKEKLGLPANFSNRTRQRDIEYNIPFYKMAELNGTTVEEMVKVFELSEDISPDSPWGDVYGEVRLEILVKMNNSTLDEFKEYFNLDMELGPETKWKDVRTEVEVFIDKQNAEGSCGDH